jgi:hypothetical protein
LLWLTIGVALVLACSTEDVPPGLRIGARWQTTRGVVGHRVHVVEHGVACADCHDLSRAEIDRPTAVSCVGACHAKENTIEHAHDDARRKLGPDAPSDCLSCHEFALGPGQTHEVAAWDCERCHDQDQGETPAVVIHRQSPCESCHQPHGGLGAQIEPARCVECHDNVSTQHATAGKTDAEICTTCHQHQHERADVARATCQKCHARTEPIISETALFAGHDACSACHQPHAETASAATPCRTCHQAINVLGGGRVQSHATCSSCHDAHDVKSAITKACVSCHTERHTNHPQATNREVCSTCHDPHPPSSQVSPARACSNCHHTAVNDNAFHSNNCQNCHKPHQFVLTAAAGSAPGSEFQGLCQECHAMEVAAARILPEHNNCAGCHKGLPHKPSTTAPCATCHAPVARVLTVKHGTCNNCHEPHTGTLTQRCNNCHAAVAQQAPAGHRACASCHETHSTVVAKTCTTCHADKSSAPHATVKGSCGTCHSAHTSRGATFAAACSTCHTVSKLGGLHQTTDHQTCANCHRSHEPTHANERIACTGRCHQDQQNHQPTSQRCAGCHLFR